MKTTMKTIVTSLVLASSLFAVPAQADAWTCLDERCESVVFEATPVFVGLPIASQAKVYTTVCERFAKAVARHPRADGYVARLRMCAILDRGKPLLWNGVYGSFTRPVFETSYLVSLELRDSR